MFGITTTQEPVGNLVRKEEGEDRCVHREKFGTKVGIPDARLSVCIASLS